MPRAAFRRPLNTDTEFAKSNGAWTVPRRHAAIAGIAAALVLLLLIAVASYRSIEGFEVRMRSVADSHEVLASLEEMFGNYAQARSAWWAYMASGDEERLRYFEASAAQAERNLEALNVAIDEPAQRARWLVLDRLVRGELENLSQMSAARGKAAFEPNSDFMYEMLMLSGSVRELQFALVEAEREILR